jgi:hypothetical protein
MKQEYGLVAAGGVSRSFLARRPGFLAHLGPIKATSFRAARRIALSLRRGHAASQYSVLEPCSMIWISVPEEGLEHVLRDLVAQTPIHRTMVVLVSVVQDSRRPTALLRAGARVATLNVVDGSGERTFVAEGHPDTMRVLQGLFTTEKKKLIEIAPAAKPFYFAGMKLASSLLLPWISASAESFRAAGFSQADALAVAGSLSVQAAYAYEKSGRKSWNKKLTIELREALEHDVDALRSSDVRLAEAYAEGLRQALKYFGGPGAARSAAK